MPGILPFQGVFFMFFISTCPAAPGERSHKVDKPNADAFSRGQSPTVHINMHDRLVAFAKIKGRDRAYCPRNIGKGVTTGIGNAFVIICILCILFCCLTF